ncbi:MAG: PIG-L deacetylase family protein [Anaerolineae bacterium]|nr:PIG-L deacetylase family protein [Anaerolineae bacterium]
MERLALLAVIAHPGDELAIAGTLANHAEAGVRVELACATRGEVGMVAGERPPEERAAQAEHNLRCACRRLGVGEPHFLGYRDSGPGGHAALEPGTLATASACDVVRRLVHLIRAVQPQVVITFGPDGIDGHPDHVLIGRLAAQAYGAAGDLEQFPRDGGPEPYLPAKLYHFGLPRGLLQLADIPGDGTPDAAIAARRDVCLFIDRKIEAARCYGPGVEPELIGLFQLPEPERHHLLSFEYFSLAQPLPAVDDRRDPHLFAGIP